MPRRFYCVDGKGQQRSAGEQKNQRELGKQDGKRAGIPPVELWVYHREGGGGIKLTSSDEWQRFIATDRHGLTEATARFLFESVRFDLFLKRAAKRVTCPVLLMLAEHDRILNNPGTRKYLTRLSGSKHVTVIDYPGAHHTLEFEPMPLVPDLLRWAGRIIGS